MNETEGPKLGFRRKRQIRVQPLRIARARFADSGKMVISSVTHFSSLCQQVNFSSEWILFTQTHMRREIESTRWLPSVYLYFTKSRYGKSQKSIL